MLGMSRTAKALEEHQRQAALRAAADPAKLARALRVIRAAVVELNLMTVADVSKAVRK